MTFNVDILIEAPDARLKPGMTAEVSVVTEQLDDVVMVPTMALMTEDGEHYYVNVATDDEGKQTHRVKVTVVTQNDNEAVVGKTQVKRDDQGNEINPNVPVTKLRDGDTLVMDTGADATADGGYGADSAVCLRRGHVMRPVIDIRNVHRIFESEAGCAHILHNVSLAVNPGEFVAITGPSGSGKSTLMNILGCLDKPTAGDYYLQGLNVAELDDEELTEVRALSIGFVFQSFNLLPRLSVIENVMLPLAYTNVPRSQREMRAVHALQAVTLPVDHWDHRISELSGGQMQRVAIARALVNDPPIILADEPTGNLDSATGALVMETFHKLQKRGKTIVLITHDPGIAAEADRAVTIRDGRIHDGAYIPHAPRTLRSAVDSLPRISASANPPKGEMA